MTQNEMILKHLKRGGSLTPASAMHLFEIDRLAARVLELRECGHRIKTARIPLSRGGGYVAQYSLQS